MFGFWRPSFEETSKTCCRRCFQDIGKKLDLSTVEFSLFPYGLHGLFTYLYVLLTFNLMHGLASLCCMLHNEC